MIFANGRKNKLGNIYYAEANSMASQGYKLDFDINISTIYESEDRSTITVAHESLIHIPYKILKIGEYVNLKNSGYYNEKSEVAFLSNINSLDNEAKDHNDAREGKNTWWNSYVNEVVYNSGNTKLIEIYEEWKNSKR